MDFKNAGAGLVFSEMSGPVMFPSLASEATSEAKAAARQLYRLPQRGLILTNKLVSFRAQAPKDRRRNNWRIVAEASRLSPGAGRPSYDSYSFADPKAANTV